MLDKSIRVESPFIAEVLDSLKRRSKALKYQHTTPVVERFIERRDEITEERVEVNFRKRPRQNLTLTLWADRTVHVSASEVIWQAGWKFQYSRAGRFVGLKGARELVQATEASLSKMFEMTTENVGLLDAIWAPLLATGPRPLSQSH